MRPEAAIRAGVESALPAGLGRLARWSRARRGDWSWLFEAETEDGSELIVKVPRWDEAGTLAAALEAGPQQDTAAEFASLAEIHDAVVAAADPGLGAVEPVAFAEPVNAIVMRRFEGQTLRSRLGAGRGGPGSARLFSRLGRWLRVFHDLGRRSTEPCRLVPPGADEPWAAPLASACSRLEGSRVEIVTLHGDLSLRNVLVAADDRVAVVDPNRRRGRPSEDLARLVAEVRLGRGQLLTRGVLRPEATVEEWLDALVDGYGALDGDVLSVDLALAAARRRAALRDRAGGAVALVWASRLLRRAIEHRIGA